MIAPDELLHQVDSPIIAIDTMQRMIYCNKAAEEIFGLQDKEWMGQPLRSVIQHPDIRALFMETSSWHTDIVLPHDGRVFSARLSRIEGKGAVVIMQPTTHQRKLDNIKNNFILNMSRDLRSPLTAILGYVELLERIGPLTEQQHDFIGRIIFSVHSMTAMLQDLQELEKITTNPDALNERVDIKQLIVYTLTAAQKRIIEKTHRCRTRLDNVPLILGNALRLRQLFKQLVENAIKYTPEGGEIGVHLYAEENVVIFKISDSGIGVAPEEHHYIFEKFYRGSNVDDTPDQRDSSGLGLSIVKTIVEQHHGRIWIDSQLGQGATFTVMLPIGERM